MVGTSLLVAAHRQTKASSTLFTMQYVSNAGSDSNDGFTWGLPKATISAAISALPQTGGTVITSSGYKATFISRLMIGSVRKYIHLEIGSGSKLTWNGNGCFLSISDGSTVTGLGTLGFTWPVILLGKGATPPLLCNAQTDGTQEYIAASNLEFQGNGALNQRAALIDLQSVFVPSYLRDILAWNWGGPILHLSSGRGNSPAYFGPFECDNCWLNGVDLTGAQPVVISQPAPYWAMGSVNFNSGAIEHAGPGEAELTCHGGDAAGKFINTVNLQGTYIENHYPNSDALEFINCQFTLSGVTAGGIGGKDLIKISQLNGDAMPSTIIGLQDASMGKFSNTINNEVTQLRYKSPTGSVPFYTFAQPGFIDAQAIFDNTGISTGISCSSAESPASCGSSAAGSFVIPAGANSVVVYTKMVTADSQIMVTFDSSLGPKLGVPCNSTFAPPWISGRIAGASFTVNTGAAPTTNPACYSFEIVN